MTLAPDTSPPPVVGHESPRETSLRGDSIGLLTTAALTAAYMGPALSIYALFGPMTAIVGTGVGFVMLIGLVVTLCSAISFGMLAKECPSAGGVYAWTRSSLGHDVGLYLGLTTAIYYTICVVFPPIVFGQFFNELLQHFGVHTNFWTWLVGALVLLVIACGITYRGIVVSSHLAVTLLITEVLVIVALALTFALVAVRHHTFTLAPLKLSSCTDGWAGVFAALPLAMLSTACDAATPASEETRNARWTIPIAVVLTCFIIGLWYVVGFSAFALGRSPQDVAALADQNYLSPITPMAAGVWGKWQILVAVTAMTASMGAFIPGATAASRVVFAMAREGNLPRRLASLHPRTRAPWNALHVVYAAALLAVFPAAYLVGPDKTIDWWGNTFGWFIAIVYTAANVANIVFYARFRRPQFNPVWNLLIPLAAIVVQLVMLWRSVLVHLWQTGPVGRANLLLIAILTAASLAYVLVHRRQRTSRRRGFDPV
jgi:amino acid transporter